MKTIDLYINQNHTFRVAKVCQNHENLCFTMQHFCFFIYRLQTNIKFLKSQNQIPQIHPASPWQTGWRAACLAGWLAGGLAGWLAGSGWAGWLWKAGLAGLASPDGWHGWLAEWIWKIEVLLSKNAIIFEILLNKKPRFCVVNQ